MCLCLDVGVRLWGMVVCEEDRVFVPCVFSIQFAHVVDFTDSEAPIVICVEDQSVATDEGKPTAMVK